jgi:hypothetical protein
MLKLFFLSVLLALGTILQAEECQNEKEYNAPCAPGPKHMRAAVRHIESAGIGYNNGYTTLEVFLAQDPREWDIIPFLDIRGHVFNDGRFAMNAGVGARGLFGCRAYGMNVYYDYRETHRRNYNQIGIGLETLGELWDLRIDGYLPIVRKVSRPYNIEFAGFKGNSILVDQRFQYAMKGIDAEAGFHFGKTTDFDFYAAAGPYYFKGELGRGAIGGKVRVAGFYREYLTLELSNSFDNVFHNKFQGQLTLTFPFGPKLRPKTTKNCCPDTCSYASMLNSRMVQPVARQEIIVVDSHTKRKAADNFIIFVNNQSHSAGTYESPYPTLDQAIAASGPGDIIYIFPGDGTTTGLNAFNTPFALQDSQQVLGAGFGHTISTNLGVITIPAQASSSPSLTANAGSSVIRVANGNTVSGLIIASDAGGTDQGSYCIGSQSGTTVDLLVSNCNLTVNNGAAGISPFNPSGHITITGNAISSADLQGVFGIYLAETGGNGFYNIENNVISNFQNGGTSPEAPLLFYGTGIAILAQDGTKANIVVAGNQVNLCTGSAIDLHSFGAGTPYVSALIENNQLLGAGTGRGIFLYAEGAAYNSFEILNNTSNGYSFGIIAQAEDTSSMTGLIQSNVLMNGIFASGIILDTNFLTQSGSATGNFAVLSNTISFFDAQGIATAAYGTSSLTVMIQNNNVHDVNKAGLYLIGSKSSNNNIYIIDNAIDSNNAGMQINPVDDAIMKFLVKGNTISNNRGAGILALPDMNGKGKYEILSNTLYGNNTNMTYDGSAVTINADGASNVCLRMLNNQSSMEATLPDYFLQNSGTGVFNVEPLTGNTGTVSESGTTAVPSGFCGS